MKKSTRIFHDGGTENVKEGSAQAGTIDGGQAADVAQGPAAPVAAEEPKAADTADKA